MQKGTIANSEKSLKLDSIKKFVNWEKKQNGTDNALLYRKR